MKRFRAVQILTCLLAAAGSVMAQQTAPLRPPAIPLVTHDPYFSVWSNTNELPAGSRLCVIPALALAVRAA